MNSPNARHCDCVYYQDWHRTSGVRAGGDRPGVHRIPAAAGGGGVRESIFSNGSAAQSQNASQHQSQSQSRPQSLQQPPVPAKRPGLPFDEEAKLVYGVVLSLRNMVKKLSGNENEQFTSYTTAQYKLHLYETLTGYKFVLLSDPSSDSLRFVLRQLHTGPFVDFVVRNPLIEMDCRTRGVDNDQFRAAVDRHIRSLTMFGP